MTRVLSKHVVTIANDLLMQPMSFSLVERRVLAMVLSSIKQSYNNKPPKELVDKMTVDQMKEFYWQQQIGEVLSDEDSFFVTVENYADLYGVTNSNARKELEDAANRLYEHSTTVELPNYIGKFRWVSAIVFDKTTGSLMLNFSKQVLPYIHNLQRHFTSIRLDKVIELQSTYSWRLYEVFRVRSGENKHVLPYFTLEDLYSLLDVPASRREYRKFKERILTPALKELEAKVVKMEVKEDKVGRKVVGLWLGYEKQQS